MLLAEYAFNEGAGTVAAEAAGGPSIAGVPAWGEGRHGAAAEVVQVPGMTLTPWAADTAFTIMFDLLVLGPGQNANYNVFLNDWEGQGDSPFGNVQVGPGGVLEWYLGADTTTVIPVGAWRHIALTGDGTWRRAYVEGTLAGQSTNANRSGTGTLVLGGFSGFHSNVRYDNLRIFDTALTQPEIAALAGTAVTPSAPSGPPPAWWDGAARQPVILRGWWDGADTQPVNVAVGG